MGGIQKQIFESILKMLERERRFFEIKTGKLNEFKKNLFPLLSSGIKSKKEEVIIILREIFIGKIDVKSKGKKYKISKKTIGGLFSNYP